MFEPRWRSGVSLYQCVYFSYFFLFSLAVGGHNSWSYYIDFFSLENMKYLKKILNIFYKYKGRKSQCFCPFPYFKTFLHIIKHNLGHICSWWIFNFRDSQVKPGVCEPWRLHSEKMKDIDIGKEYIIPSPGYRNVRERASTSRQDREDSKYKRTGLVSISFLSSLS